VNATQQLFFYASFSALICQHETNIIVIIHYYIFNGKSYKVHYEYGK
jgi:hypothetical protein